MLAAVLGRLLSSSIPTVSAINGHAVSEFEVLFQQSASRPINFFRFGTIELNRPIHF